MSLEQLDEFLTQLRAAPTERRPVRRTPNWTNVINAHRASRLRNKGMTWAQVGVALAKEDERRTPYSGIAVAQAVRQYLAGERDAFPECGS